MNYDRWANIKDGVVFALAVFGLVCLGAIIAVFLVSLF